MHLETFESEAHHLSWIRGTDVPSVGGLQDNPISLGSMLTCTLLDFHLGLLETLQHAPEISDAILEGNLLILALLGPFQELPNLWGNAQIIIIFLLLLLFLLNYFPGEAATQ